MKIDNKIKLNDQTMDDFNQSLEEIADQTPSDQNEEK